MHAVYTVTDRLRRILETKRRHVTARRTAVPESVLEVQAEAQEAPRGFAAGLTQAVGHANYGLIAEIKQASPSKGLLRREFDPATLAAAMHRGGAACLSILTDQPYFAGSDSHLAAARAAAPLPTLRKDFLLTPYQVLESRALGADCVLLILAALDDRAARTLARDAKALGMDVLVEVHDERELDRAASLTPDLIGVNNRNLRTFEVDLATTEQLAAVAPAGLDLVAESGVHGPGDLHRLADCGVRRFLVGETLMRSKDVEQAVRLLLAGQAGRA